MSVDPTMVISIDHAGPYPVAGADAPLVAYGRLDDNPLFGINRWREPASEPQVTYADKANNQHGSIATEWSYPDILLDWSVFTHAAATEAESRARLALMRAFLGRLRYAVTVTVAGAPPETWSCKPGSLTPAADRTRNDLADGNPVWNVLIPAHPIRSL